MDNHNVCVLGGGISGITVGLVLQSLGFNPTIVAKTRPLQTPATPPFSMVPTGYAMASAYPHNLFVENLEQISDHSQAVFRALYERCNAGIDIYKIFEVYEDQPGKAALGERRMNFQTFEGTPDSLKVTIDPPARPGAKYLWGWTFDSYFADMPQYLEFLWSTFTSQGGKFESRAITPENLETISAGRPVINCLGLGAVRAFDDNSEAKIVRGRQVLVANAPLVRAADGKPLAYDYTPTADVFTRADGLAEYVHFFSRSDGWVLGQTREPGVVDENGIWSGAPVKADEMLIDGESVPRQIIELNAQLLKNWRNIDVPDNGLSARTGFRYYRDPSKTGVRLEMDNFNGQPLVHNYGHGGSGITMSWGCAIRCAQLLTAEISAKPANETLLSSEIRELISAS